MIPGIPGSIVPRTNGKSALWFIATRRGPAALALDEDGLLDVEDRALDDHYFPDAPAWTERSVAFLKSTRHDALPAYVDHWIGKGGKYARAVGVVNGRLETALYDGLTFYAATRRVVAVEGWDYFRHNRLPAAGLPLLVSVRIVERIADLCAIAHRAGVLHGGIAVAGMVVQPNGRPQLEGFCGSSWRARDNVSFDYEGLWGIKKALGKDPMAASVEDEVFRLGCLLSTLLTGAPPYEGERAAMRYRPPSSRVSVPPAVDDIVGAACDPARGFKADAAWMQRALASVLAAGRPSVDRAHQCLRDGDFIALAELMACTDSAEAHGLGSEARDAVERFVTGAIRRGQFTPLFSELVLAVCPDARAPVRDLARERSAPNWMRVAAISQLARVDDAEALPIMMQMAHEGRSPFSSVGWSARPELVSESGEVCPHPWTSMVGEPLNEPLRRTCPSCGPTLLAEAWMGRKYRQAREADEALGPQTKEPTPFPELWLEIKDPREGEARVEVPIGYPHLISSEPKSSVFVEGLHPAYHASLLRCGPYEIECALRVSNGFVGYELARSVAIETATPITEGSNGEPRSPLRIGPLELVVLGPGRIEIRPDPGTRVCLGGDPSAAERDDR